MDQENRVFVLSYTLRDADKILEKYEAAATRAAPSPSMDHSHRNSHNSHSNRPPTPPSSHDAVPTFMIIEPYRAPYTTTDDLATFLSSVQDDEDVIFFDGGEAYTAYKRVDRKVKPVPAVFPATGIHQG